MVACKPLAAGLSLDTAAVEDGARRKAAELMTHARLTASETHGQSAPEIAYVDMANIVAVQRNLILVVALGEPRRPLADAMARIFRRVAAREGSAGVLIFVDRDCPPPDEAARPIMKEIFETFDARCASVSLYIDGDGFVVAAKRSIATLVIMARKSTVRMKILSTLKESVSWLYTQLGKNAPAEVMVADVVASVEQLRSDHKAGRLEPTA
jgi:hypothetical protein